MEGLSLVIPAHNSERVIKNSIKNYYKRFSNKFNPFEMIVVCNDCWDNTPKICKSLEKKYPVRTIEIPQRGKGYALIKGLGETRFDTVGFLDADNPFDLDRILKMIDNLNLYDIVIVSKYQRGKARQQEFFTRRMLALGGSIVSRVLFNINFKDTQAGAKFFKKDVWDKLKSAYLSTGFEWDIEFLYKAKKNNFKILEVYIPWKSDKFSTFRFKYLPGMLYRLLKLRFLK